MTIEKKLDDIFNILESIVKKLNTFEENQKTQTDEIRSIKQTLLTNFQPKQEEKKWRQSKSGRSEWIPVSEDPELAKQLIVGGWRQIGNYVYRVTDDGRAIIRVRRCP
jgi:phage gpG-like protein